MFAKSVNLIVKQLNAFITSSEEGGDPDHVKLGNIALADVQNPTPQIQQCVVASVINIAEESALKNAPHFELRGNQTRYRNPPAYLNLYLLFSANYDDYETALKRLSQVVTFFQGTNVFTLNNSPDPKSVEDDGLFDVRLILELFALTFEQVNYVWASLGGRQMPFVLYKVRLVRIDADRTQGESPVIEEIGADESTV